MGKGKPIGTRVGYLAGFEQRGKFHRVCCQYHCSVGHAGFLVLYFMIELA